MRTLLTCCTVATLLLASASTSFAQRPESAEANAATEAEQWFYESGQMKVDPLRVHQAKSAQRAAQRQARIASLNWYGMSVARPTASATPFTGMYSPAWQMPGGRPFAWYPRSYQSTVYIVR